MERDNLLIDKEIDLGTDLQKEVELELFSKNMRGKYFLVLSFELENGRKVLGFFIGKQTKTLIDKNHFLEFSTLE